VVVRPHGDDYQACLISDGKYWGLPKGNVEPGESPEQTALREIAEETGLPIESLTVLGELPPSEYVYRRRDSGRLIFKRVHQYLVGSPPDAELHPDPAEIAEADWLSLDEAMQRVSFRDTQAALREARRLLAAGALQRAR
jgi:8-oxo-dGTP pyrophosphatase MutT (NUDIX family)